MATRLLIGDCRDVLRTLPDESVHCVVTSPPYFGLRDYGTATWEGGDSDCSHIERMARGDTERETPGGRGGSFRGGAIQFNGLCPCGARRIDSQIGLEPTPDAYVAEMVAVFREVRRVLRRDGTLFLNLGDSYASGGRKTRDPGQSKIHPAFEGDSYGEGLRPADPPGIKPKDLLGIPWRCAFALQADGWWLRQDLIWAKPNPMPESVTDRCTRAHEYVFLMARSERYFYDAAAIAEPFADERMGNPGAYKRTTSRAKGAVNDRQDLGFLNNGDGWNADGSNFTRNRRSVWTVASQPFSEAHFATFPPALIEPCILAGCPKGGVVLDPFSGAGTTGLVADRLQRDAVLIELNPAYAAMSSARIADDSGLFASIDVGGG